MLFILCFLLLSKILITWSANAGSAIFYNTFTRMGCWNERDIAKLRARKLFEQMVPSLVSPERMNSKYIKNTIRYYRQALYSVEKEDQRVSVALKEALADTIGAHLRSEVLPTARFAYYAGYVPYISVRDLHDFYDNIKKMLNTQGLGWKKPKSIPEWSNLTVAKIVIGNGKYFDPCGCLIMKRDTSECMHLSSPKLDDDREPSAIALPLKTGGLVSLTSMESENILLKYYTSTARCILNSSPAACRHKDFVNFNNEMWHWMKRNVAPHLVDEKLYAAYGGVLRIAAAVQSYGKGLSRRNLFDIQNARSINWRSWKAFTDPYIYVNTDWTPHLYVGVVLLAAFSICLLQICYNFIMSDEDGCTCKRRRKQTYSTDVSYAGVESNIPAMLPSSHQSAVFYSEQRRMNRSSSRAKSISLGSLKTQKVYDLNENTEKLMAVIMSDKETNSEGSESTAKDHLSDASPSKRSTSPPKIETDISQVQLSKCSKKQSKLPFFSTSSVTRSETYREQGTDTNWSEYSSSSESMSSTTSRGRRSRSSRDLEWARREASKHILRKKSTSGTELDYTSYTTPPSKR